MIKRELTPLEKEEIEEDEKVFMEGLEEKFEPVLAYMRRHSTLRDFHAEEVQSKFLSAAVEILVADDKKTCFSDLHKRTLARVMDTQRALLHGEPVTHKVPIRILK